MSELPRILCVDDDVNVLEGMRRSLRRSYEVVTAVGGEEGIRALYRGQSFAVVISDQRMPGVDGVALLEHINQEHPDTVRILLTGYTNVDAAIAAVNRGAVFRFLTKPCAPEVLNQAVAAAVDQNRLIKAERVLLEQTLHGSVRALTEILAMVHPAGFGRATRTKAMVSEIVAHLDLKGGWQVEIAAMLSQIGTVTLAPELVEKHYSGRPMSHAERVCIDRLPRLASEVVANIPRLEDVRDILLQTALRYDGIGTPPGRAVGQEILWPSRLLRLVLDLDLLESHGVQRRPALAMLRSREGWYDPVLLEGMTSLYENHGLEPQVQEIELAAIRPGMVFAEDVHSTTGILLVARGQEASERLVDRIRNVLHLVETRQVVRVMIPSVELSATAATVPAAEVCIPASVADAR